MGSEPGASAEGHVGESALLLAVEEVLEGCVTMVKGCETSCLELAEALLDASGEVAARKHGDRLRWLSSGDDWVAGTVLLGCRLVSKRCIVCRSW